MNQSKLAIWTRLKKYGWVGLILGLLAAFIVVYLYLDRYNQLSGAILSLGWLGIIIAVLLMAALCMTPVPSEGLVILYLKIYGVFGGILVSWVGSTLSSLVIFVVARYYGQRVIKKFVKPQRFEVVDNWVERKGTFGLFVARLLPIPAFAVNYVAGVIPSVRFWPYMWTAALSIIPYYVGTALVFLGVAKEVWIYLIIGCVCIVAFWSIGYLLNRKKLI